MTRTISLITATVGAALLFAIPANADNWGADKQQPSTTSSPDWFERAAGVAIQKQKVEMLNARERGLGITAQAVLVDPRSEGMNRLYGLGEYANPVVADDRFRIDHSNVPETVSVSSSGREFDLPQIGIGLGIGIVLLLGIALLMRAAHVRPFAH